MYLNMVIDVVSAQRPSARMMATAPMWWMPDEGREGGREGEVEM